MKNDFHRKVPCTSTLLSTIWPRSKFDDLPDRDLNSGPKIAEPACSPLVYSGSWRRARSHCFYAWHKQPCLDALTHRPVLAEWQGDISVFLQTDKGRLATRGLLGRGWSSELDHFYLTRQFVSCCSEFNSSNTETTLVYNPVVTNTFLNPSPSLYLPPS